MGAVTLTPISDVGPNYRPVFSFQVRESIEIEKIFKSLVDTHVDGILILSHRLMTACQRNWNKMVKTNAGTSPREECSPRALGGPEPRVACSRGKARAGVPSLNGMATSLEVA